LSTVVSAALALATLLASPTAAADELDTYKEVSYLVFQRSAGFDRPTFESDLLDGTITVRFRRIPRNWRSLLNVQVASASKARFFRAMTPIKRNGKLVGIQLQVGIGAFSIKTYNKRRPMRWVLRIGEVRRPPFSFGREGVPVVPYSDLIEDDVEGRSAFAAAEFDLASGRLDGACRTFASLRGGDPELTSWATIRVADCLLELGNHKAAIKQLKTVMSAGHTPAAVFLARLRLEEATGRILTAGFQRELYQSDVRRATHMGTVADEAAFREARALLLRRQIDDALAVIEGLHQRRSQSPIFVDRRFLNALRWRAVRDASVEEKWLSTARTYLRIPTDNKRMPHWLEIHRIGARALREIGLSKRAVRVYLHLLEDKNLGYEERDLIRDLAHTYHEAGDQYRASITLTFLLERYPELRRDAGVIRLQGRLALAQENGSRMGEVVAELKAMAPELTSQDDERFVATVAMRALEIDGLAAARATINGIGGQLPTTIARDLAMAAGDCDDLAKHVGPLILAQAETMLWTGACLMGQRRADEARVYLEAARVYTGAEILLPRMDPILKAVETSAQWWLQNEKRVAAAQPAENQG